MRKLVPDDTALIQLIASWYFQEWKLPLEQTVARLFKIAADPDQVQLVFFKGSMPVATGGIYYHVGLLDRVPRLRVHRHWLGMVYTVPEQRNKGYGAKLCRSLANAAKDLGMDELHLFTDTAANFYRKLGWTEVEVLEIEERNLTIMRLQI